MAAREAHSLAQFAACDGYKGAAQRPGNVCAIFWERKSIDVREEGGGLLTLDSASRSVEPRNLSLHNQGGDYLDIGTAGVGTGKLGLRMAWE
jgi:hypothetical protein